MFNNKRYVTRGISNEVSPIIQAILWKLTDEMDVPKKDYLQVFILSGSGNEQVIVHEQEEPPYKKECRLKLVDTPVFIGKIFVIDDDDHSTMLLAEEY